MKKVFFVLRVSLVCCIGLSASAQDYGTGLLIDDAAYQEIPLKATLIARDYGDIPSSYSLKAYCPEPKNQGTYATCVGWSSAYAARTILEAQKQGWKTQEEITKNALSATYLYRLIRQTQDTTCRYGTFISDALSIMQSRGVPLYERFHPLCPENASLNDELNQQAGAYKIQSFHRLFDISDSPNYKLKVVKKAISQNSPVIFGIKCPPSFWKAQDYWQPDANESPLNNYGGHAMCVIGYDNQKYEDEGAFEVMNSWGSDWGNAGFIWIKYSDFASYAKYAYEIVNTEAPQTQALDLAGELKLVTQANQEMTASFVHKDQNILYYRLQKAYPSGTRFRIYISNQEPAFVYALGTDLTGEVFRIFPNEEGISPALNYQSNQVAIPDERYYIQLDQQAGKDYLCVLYAKNPLDTKRLYRQMQNLKGSFTEKLNKILNQELITGKKVRQATEQVAFQASSQDGQVVALLLEIEHQ